MTKLNTGEEIRALTDVETQIVSGGLVPLNAGIGTALPYYAAINLFVSPLDKVALNPQPLPPRDTVHSMF
jgi:hypothetical protein